MRVIIWSSLSTILIGCDNTQGLYYYICKIWHLRKWRINDQQAFVSALTNYEYYINSKDFEKPQ